MNQINTSWLELNTHQPESSMAFYSETLGWEFESIPLPEGGDYWLAKHNDQPVGGVFELDEKNHDDIPSHWMTYMHVTDIIEAQTAARNSGGEVARPVLHLSGIGKLAVICDSSGAMVGLIETDGTQPIRHKDEHSLSNAEVSSQ